MATLTPPILVVGSTVQAYDAELTTLAAMTLGTTGLALLDDTTPAIARDTAVWASSGAIDPASPYSVVAGVYTITLGSSKTVALPALSTYVDGQVLRVINSSSSSITVTLDPAGTDTIDGGGAGSSAAYPVSARGSLGAVRLSASAWGSVQLGSAVASIALAGAERTETSSNTLPVVAVTAL